MENDSMTCNKTSGMTRLGFISSLLAWQWCVVALSSIPGWSQQVQGGVSVLNDWNQHDIAVPESWRVLNYWWVSQDELLALIMQRNGAGDGSESSSVARININTGGMQTLSPNIGKHNFQSIRPSPNGQRLLLEEGIGPSREWVVTGLDGHEYDRQDRASWRT